jgi:glycerophosphoryl diester phosphodiesterase
MWFCLVVSVVSWVHAGSPVLVGHRGGMAGDPENSLVAFRHGRQFGRDLETDIRFTRDHVPVILHDRTLDRTTECQGLVSDYAWEQVRRCRLQTPFPCKITHHTLPTLQTVLSDRRLQTVRWILEIKAYDPVGIDRVWRIVRGKKGIAIASFDRKILHYLQVHHTVHSVCILFPVLYHARFQAASRA